MKAGGATGVARLGVSVWWRVCAVVVIPFVPVGLGVSPGAFCLVKTGSGASAARRQVKGLEGADGYCVCGVLWSRWCSRDWAVASFEAEDPPLGFAF